MIWLLMAAVGPYTPGVDSVDVVEINTFGTTRVRTALIYRDPPTHESPAGKIVDWRWYKTPEQIPLASKRGYVAVWSEHGKPRTVYCRRVVMTRTLNDIELSERAAWPVHKRRKLTR